jgi:secreted trypsin-like serine protease
MNFKKLCSCFLFAGLVATALTPAHAIIVRHDVADSKYVVADDDYPALVDLFSPNDCIGSLVHESYLLTVAHCAVDLREGESLVVNGASHAVAEVILHPMWRERADEYDIALVRFEIPVKSVALLAIYSGSSELGSVIALVGRGVTATGLQGEAGGDSDGNLRRATNTVSAVDDHFIEIIFERAGDEGVTDLEGVGASGDSGGPAFIEEDGMTYIAGLNSWGDGSNGIRVGQYGARDYQTRVSRYLEWLDSVINAPPNEPGDPSTEPDAAGAGCSTSGLAGGRGSAWGLLFVLVVIWRRRRAVRYPKQT